MVDNVFDNYDTQIEDLDIPEPEPRCGHHGLIRSEQVLIEEPERHTHMGSVCEDCHEVLGYFATHCHVCGPLP